MMNTSILKKYKESNPAQLEELLSVEICKSNKKIIVLDDDPTGVQTVHDVSVYTDWSCDSIRKGFASSASLFYILTNSRSFTAKETASVHMLIAQTIDDVSKEFSKDYLIISRSDSTLRGHYPLETETLKSVYEQKHGISVDGEIFCPFFKEGGRYTLDNIHYVQCGSRLLPAASTEFAQDATFGYASSDLRNYIEEKTKGAFPASDVVCISLESLRSLDFDAIEAQLMDITDFNKVIVNAIDYCDLQVFCIALYRAMTKGKHFLFRSAASFVKVIAGVSDQPLLTREDMVSVPANSGGLIIIGSYTDKTTAQLEKLSELTAVTTIAFHSHLVLQHKKLSEEIKQVAALADCKIKEGKTVAIYTQRKQLKLDADTKEDVLLRSITISKALQHIVASLNSVPSFIITKGGITSSDIYTKALGIKHAIVIGQAAPGVPVWKTDSNSHFSNIPCIIFPGNVGGDNTLKDVVSKLL